MVVVEMDWRGFDDLVWSRSELVPPGDVATEETRGVGGVGVGGGVGVIPVDSRGFDST